MNISRPLPILLYFLILQTENGKTRGLDWLFKRNEEMDKQNASYDIHHKTFKKIVEFVKQYSV